MPQPDLNLRILPDYGGGSWVEDRYLHGIPELLAEIARSSASYDLHVKLELYQAVKVPEYLVILLFEREIRWHVLVNGRYQLLPPDPDYLVGYLAIAALLAGIGWLASTIWLNHPLSAEIFRALTTVRDFLKLVKNR